MQPNAHNFNIRMAAKRWAFAVATYDTKQLSLVGTGAVSSRNPYTYACLPVGLMT